MRHPLLNPSSRLISTLLVVALLVVAAVQISNPHSYLSEVVARVGEVGSGPEASLTDLSSIGQLQSDFNRDAGHPRLLLLFSPT
jgi:hypothetical protein